jgi:hypothetical protein
VGAALARRTRGRPANRRLQQKAIDARWNAAQKQMVLTGGCITICACTGRKSGSGRNAVAERKVDLVRLALAENLSAWMHEPGLSQYLGGKLKFLEIVEREVGSRRGKIEALVADLDHS